MVIAQPSDPTATGGQFHYWKNPDPASISEDVLEFLHGLPGPTHIHLSGKDPARCRLVATLLHGNEPSGLHGVVALLKRRIEPAVDLHLLIPSVDAARQTPVFSHRMLPQQKDLNRCFQQPFGDSAQDLLAREIVNIIAACQPESIIDIHNTSGSSPAFGITTLLDARHEALVALFTRRLVVTDLRLGALMELGSGSMPVVTIECGGAGDPAAHELARVGLERYATLETLGTLADVPDFEQREPSLELFRNPGRLELNADADIVYGEHSLLEDGVTLLPGVEKHNFGYVEQTDQLGFVGGMLNDKLVVQHPAGQRPASDFFRLHNGELFPREKLKLFMVTTNPEIARKDCLFYLVRAGEQ